MVGVTWNLGVKVVFFGLPDSAAVTNPNFDRLDKKSLAATE